MVPSLAANTPLPNTCVVWAPSLTAYNFGPGHPMAPARLALTAELSEQLGLFDRDAVTVAEPYVASDLELLSVHDAEYIAAVRSVSANPHPVPERGLGTVDDPAFAGMHEASARLVGGSLRAAQAILAGTAQRGVNFSGGMHHADRGSASGFCIYNDAAAAVQLLLDSGVNSVAYLDIDAHHGDGTQNIFYNDPRVLTVSLHESGLSLFPGTGFANDTGGPRAVGTAVNIALPAYTGDGGWLRAFHAVVPQVVRAFGPEVIVSQHGCDSHRSDPLTHLNTTVDAQREAAMSIAALADELCEGRWLATGGGGYSVADVVPRVWAHLVAIVSGRPIPLREQVPELWRERVKAAFGEEAPNLMGDDADLWWRSWEVGYNPADAVDRAIMATRKEIFPLYGLDPWFD
ncbi:acetoin utilization protein [Renibacterium salmoninarum ATCC 33209]|uniref:Acetoin utilization protein AcuC n=1 Tax=Renibacterium salmoninarum (strain ATCC 33209 / DSM 20767 / JCM 11484 / NBRC 15589 / NCIMB 2235) TaxID=288705 RepID=A9WTC8_RENSM|nr:acetoin utilization protein AcuC [Renibacterium salmoninarum]ABY24449.1 acetoin utilization protein [Renibacterium salmoninarum ATCC 33209]